VLEPGDVDAVALAGVARLGVGEELRNQEQAEPLGSRSGALRPRQHHVEDVLEEVVGIAVGDEPLDAFQMPAAVGLRDGLGTAHPDVRPGIGLGEHHRRAPVAFEGQCRAVLLLLVAEVVQDVREDRPGQIHERCRLGAEWELVDGPSHHRGRRHATDVLGEPDAEPLALLPRAEGLLEGFGEGDGVGVGIERRRVTVALGE
jgi:hypothetical protein